MTGKSRISTLDLILPPKYKLKIFSTICVIPNLDSKFPIFIFYFKFRDPCVIELN